MVLELIITGITVAAKQFAKYNGIAKNNKGQADFYAGQAVDVLEVKVWKHRALSPKNINDYFIWAKVASIDHFAVGQTVTITQKGQLLSDHFGKWRVKDIWKDFPKKDPEVLYRNMAGASLLFGITGSTSRYDALPFQQGAFPGVLKLEKEDKSKIKHSNEQNQAIIFSGTERKPDQTTNEFKNSFAGTVSNFLSNAKTELDTAAASEKALYYEIGFLAIVLLIIILIFTKKH
jgi:hypothetical protein